MSKDHIHGRQGEDNGVGNENIEERIRRRDAQEFNGFLRSLRSGGSAKGNNGEEPGEKEGVEEGRGISSGFHGGVGSASLSGISGIGSGGRMDSGRADGHMFSRGVWSASSAGEMSLASAANGALPPSDYGRGEISSSAGVGGGFGESDFAQQYDVGLSELLERLRAYWAESGFRAEDIALASSTGPSPESVLSNPSVASADHEQHFDAVDVNRARNLLEASAGNVDLAVALYWDDFFASAHATSTSVYSAYSSNPSSASQTNSLADRASAKPNVPYSNANIMNNNVTHSTERTAANPPYASMSIPAPSPSSSAPTASRHQPLAQHLHVASALSRQGADESPLNIDDANNLPSTASVPINMTLTHASMHSRRDGKERRLANTQSSSSDTRKLPETAQMAPLDSDAPIDRRRVAAEAVATMALAAAARHHRRQQHVADEQANQDDAYLHRQAEHIAAEMERVAAAAFSQGTDGASLATAQSGNSINDGHHSLPRDRSGASTISAQQDQHRHERSRNHHHFSQQRHRRSTNLRTRTNNNNENDDEIDVNEQEDESENFSLVEVAMANVQNNLVQEDRNVEEGADDAGNGNADAAVAAAAGESVSVSDDEDLAAALADKVKRSRFHDKCHHLEEDNENNEDGNPKNEKNDQGNETTQSPDSKAKDDTENLKDKGETGSGEDSEADDEDDSDCGCDFLSDDEDDFTDDPSLFDSASISSGPLGGLTTSSSGPSPPKLYRPAPILWGGNFATGENALGAGRIRDRIHNIRGRTKKGPWLRAGFTLSPGGTGLILTAPSDEEKAELLRIGRTRLAGGVAATQQQAQQQGQPCRSTRGPIAPNRRTISPVQVASPALPFHCGGMTALVSLVTALLYTGASVQGNEINCSSLRKPFARLSLDEKRREYDLRLSDALSALLHVAAMAALRRRSRALTKIEEKISGNCGKQMNARKRKLETLNTEDTLGNKARKSNRNKTNQRLPKPSTEENKDNQSESRGSSSEWLRLSGKENAQSQSCLQSLKAESDQMMKQQLRRRLRLCRVCRWEQDADTGEAKIPSVPVVGWNDGTDGDDVNGNNDDEYLAEVGVLVSRTNIRDLRSYVLSVIRSFTAPGGCALFLETIIKIHGTRRVERMVRRARAAAKRAGLTTAKSTLDSPLFGCSCISRWTEACESGHLPTHRSGTSSIEGNRKLCIPPGHECVSLELLSLLLTGSVDLNPQRWNVERFGLGFMSTKDDIAGWTRDPPSGRNRPKSPAWIIRGDSCYSTVWLDEAKEPNNGKDAFADLCSCEFKDDQPWATNGRCNDDIAPLFRSESFRILHWNSWYGIRNMTTMRIVGANKRTTGDVNSRKREQQTLSTFNSDSDGLGKTENGKGDKRSVFESKKKIEWSEVEKVAFHPDDEALYPGEYRRWRFDLGDNERSSDVAALDKNIRPLALGRWIQFFRLNRRQKEIVELKLAPRINAAIHLNWPGSTVVEFEPTDGPAPIV